MDPRIWKPTQGCRLCNHALNVEEEKVMERRAWKSRKGEGRKVRRRGGGEDFKEVGSKKQT